MNAILGYGDIPPELPDDVDVNDVEELMDRTCLRVQLLKDNAYAYHLAMCRKEGRM